MSDYGHDDAMRDMEGIALKEIHTARGRHLRMEEYRRLTAYIALLEAMPDDPMAEAYLAPERIEAQAEWTDAELASKCDRLLAAAKALVDVAEFEVDDDECWFDYHGYCQAHGCGDMGDQETPHCPTAALKEHIAACRAVIAEAKGETP